MNIFWKTLSYVATFVGGVVVGGLAVQKYLERQMATNMENATRMLSQMKPDNLNQNVEPPIPLQTQPVLNVVSESSQLNQLPNSSLNVVKSEIVPLNLTAESIGKKSLKI